MVKDDVPEVFQGAMYVYSIVASIIFIYNKSKDLAQIHAQTEYQTQLNEYHTYIANREVQSYMAALLHSSATDLDVRDKVAGRAPRRGRQKRVRTLYLAVVRLLDIFDSAGFESLFNQIIQIARHLLTLEA